MLRYVKDLFTKRFYTFLLAGGIAALINFTSRIFLSYLFIYAIAVTLAYLIGMLIAFFLCKVFVFEESDQSTIKQFNYFTLVNVAAIIQTVGISVFLAKWLFPELGITLYNEEIAHFIGISIPAVTSYFGHKYLSFKKSVVEEQS